MDPRQSRQAWLDRLTATLGFDVRFYARSFTWLGLGQASGVVRGVATTFLMARWLPRETLGEFRYVLAVFAVAGMFSAGGVGTSIIRGFAKGEPSVAWAGFRRVLSIAPAGTVLLLFAAADRLRNGEDSVAAALAIAAVAFPAYAASSLYGPILVGQERIGTLSQRAIANNLAFAACFFAVIWHTTALIPIFGAYLGFDILFRGFLTWNELRRLPRSGDASEHIRLGDHLSAIGMFQAVAGQLDQLLLQRFAGYGTLANYSVAMLVPEQVKDFVNAIGGVLLQRFSRYASGQKVLPQTRRHFWTMAALSAGAVAAYAAAAPLAIPLLFPQYTNEVLPSVVYALGLLALPGIIGLNYFQAHRYVAGLWRFYAANTALQIASNTVLIPLFGAWGAVWSKTLTRLSGLPLAYPRKIPETAAGNETAG